MAAPQPTAASAASRESARGLPAPEAHATALDVRGLAVEGYACVYRRLHVHRDFVDCVERACFAASLASGARVPFLIGHDKGRALGCTESGSLQLAEDAHGLAFRLALPDGAAGRQLAADAASGAMRMSIGFIPLEEGWDERDGVRWRTLHAAALTEISAVPTPAIAETFLRLVDTRMAPSFRATVRHGRLAVAAQLT